MTRNLIYLVTFFLAFVVGVLISKSYFFWKVDFINQGGGSFGMCDGKGFGSYSLKESYDGVKLSFSSAKFSSSRVAEKCFRRQLQEATKVIEREALYDKAGKKIVGERVVAVFSPNSGQDGETAAIISLDEDKIYEIVSFSLRHALVYENRMRNH